MKQAAEQAEKDVLREKEVSSALEMALLERVVSRFVWRYFLHSGFHQNMSFYIMFFFQNVSSVCLSHWVPG